MGMIKIEISGSFKRKNIVSFSAMRSGHAVAIHNAVMFLKNIHLPRAIEQDKEMRAEGQAPEDEWEEADDRKLL